MIPLIPNNSKTKLAFVAVGAVGAVTVLFGCCAKPSSSGRAVREQELHPRLAKHGLSLAADITYAPIPILKQDKDGDDIVEICEWPMLLPSSLATWLVFGIYCRTLRA